MLILQEGIGRAAGTLLRRSAVGTPVRGGMECGVVRPVGGLRSLPALICLCRLSRLCGLGLAGGAGALFGVPDVGTDGGATGQIGRG